MVFNLLLKLKKLALLMLLWMSMIVIKVFGDFAAPLGEVLGLDVFLFLVLF